jgi:transposase
MSKSDEGDCQWIYCSTQLNVMTLLKYSVGIDVAKQDFKACLAVIDCQQKVVVKATGSFSNSAVGYDQFSTWFLKHQKAKLSIHFLMEATGIYHEHLAWFLFKKGCAVSVILPNKAKKYIQGLGIKSKNDKIDAKGLAKMGAEQSLPLWKPISKNIYRLRALTRLHEDLSVQRSSLNNRLHSLEYAMFELNEPKKSLQKIVTEIDKQLSDLEKKIKEAITSDVQLNGKYKKITKIKGVGLMTFAVVVAETNGFELFTSIPQLTSYAGYDVIENQSGNAKGKSRMSKKGNAHIRRVLHMPAFNVVKFEPEFKAFFNRIFEKTTIKMKGYVAVQRKLLTLIYTLWKKDSEYQPGIQRQESQILFGAIPKESKKPNTLCLAI